MMPIVGLYHAWFVAHDNFPGIEFGSFVASQVQSTPESPEAISEIVEAHRALCTKAEELLEQYWGSKIQRHMNYDLLPICRVVILLFDCWEELGHLNRRTPDYPLQWEKEHTILMIRTGEEENLSSPVSFDNICS